MNACLSNRLRRFASVGSIGMALRTLSAIASADLVRIVMAQPVREAFEGGIIHNDDWDFGLYAEGNPNHL